MVDVELHVYDREVRVKFTVSKIADIIDDLLSYFISSARHIKKHKINEAEANDDSAEVSRWKDWDGKFHLYRNNKFPIGFLWRVKVQLELNDYEVSVIEHRTKPQKLPERLRPKFNGVLRPYQEEALTKMLNNRNGIVEMGTGAGKTVLALALLEKRPYHTFIVVPSIELANEWLGKAKQFLSFPDGVNHVGYITGKQDDIDIINIVNVSILRNALFRNTTKPKTRARYDRIIHAYINADMIIVDECHGASAPETKKVLNESRAYFRYGLSATLDMRSDESDMEYYGLLGEKIAKVSTSDLIEKGHLTPFLVKFHAVGYTYTKPRTKWGGVGGVEDRAIVFNSKRNDIVTTVAWKSWVSEKRQTLILVRRLDHGSTLLDKINKLHEKSPISKTTDCVAEWVHGEHPRRNEIIQNFRDGKVNILIAQYQLLGQGIDIPAISSVVMALGGKSAIVTIQGIGRGSRKAENKKDVIIHDFVDEGTYVEEHTDERLMTYAKERAFKIDATGTILEEYTQHLIDVGELIS